MISIIFCKDFNEIVEQHYKVITVGNLDHFSYNCKNKDKLCQDELKVFLKNIVKEYLVIIRTNNNPSYKIINIIKSVFISASSILDKLLFYLVYWSTFWKL